MFADEEPGVSGYSASNRNTVTMASVFPDGECFYGPCYQVLCKNIFRKFDPPLKIGVETSLQGEERAFSETL
jgi:hypothetical protein